MKVPDGAMQQAKLQPEPQDAEVVRRIFSMALGGMGVKEIATRLNAEKVSSPRGKRWGKGAVHNVLVNPACVGSVVWGVSGAYHRLAGLAPVKVENAFPSIVDVETFGRVQALLRSRRPSVVAPRSVSGPYLLGGLLRCGACGAAMWGQGAKSGRYHYYVCATKTRVSRNLCRTRPIPQDTIEGLVVSKLGELVLRDDHLAELVRLVNAGLAAARSDVAARMKAMEDQIREVSARLDRLYEVLETGKLCLDDLAPRIRELKQRRDELEVARDHLTASGSPTASDMVSKEAVLGCLKDLRPVLAHGSPSEQRQVLRSFVRSITTLDSEVTIDYTLPMPPQREPLDGAGVLALVHGSGARRSDVDTERPGTANGELVGSVTATDPATLGKSRTTSLRCHEKARFRL